MIVDQNNRISALRQPNISLETNKSQNHVYVHYYILRKWNLSVFDFICKIHYHKFDL